MNPSVGTHKFLLIAVAALGAGLPVFGGITYTCDPSINLDAYANLCATLNGTAGTAFTGGLAGLYNSTFTNANATIYIQFNNNGGLGESTPGFGADATYAQYQNQLQIKSTDPAKLTVPATEPGLYSGGGVFLTNALANALGFTGVDGVEFNPGGDAQNGWAGSSCTSPGDGAVVVASPTACYNGILTLNTPALLDSQDNQGYTYRGLGGSTTSATGGNYDIYSIIEHETDEILGTSSCYFTTPGSAGPPIVPGSITDGCGGTNVSAADLFRYSAPNTRTINTVGGTAYFSANNGTTDYEGNQYDNLENGNDWADFSNNCTFVQDGFGCPNGQPFDITSDNNGTSGAGPEVAILNAVGYNLANPTPEPSTLGLLGVSLAALALGRKRLHGK
jgi:hypothetical protein